MKKKLLLAATALSLAMGHAQAQDLKSKFLDNFANAVAVDAKCKAWKVNPEMAKPGSIIGNSYILGKPMTLVCKTDHILVTGSALCASRRASLTSLKAP